MKRYLLFGWAGLSALFLLTPFFSRAVPGDEHWDPQFNWPGTTNAIFGIAVHNGKIYSGGYVSVGSTTNGALAVWDGLQWSLMTSFQGSTPPINDIAFVGNTLYVAGTFNNVGGTPISGLAKWDGTSWSSVGLSGSVVALAVSGGNLYAGGAFTNADAGGVVMTNIGYWDGSAWHAMGNGLGTRGFGAVRAIAIQSGLIYAGGLFTNSGPQLMTNTAVWNGTNWSAVGGGIDSAVSIVYSLTFKGSDLYAAGIFTQAGSTVATNIAKWDGLSWSAVGGGLSGSSVNSLATFNGLICAAGSFTNAGGMQVTNFAVWNGSSWSGANGGVSAIGYRIVDNGTNVYVGGNFLAAGNKLMNGIASWDGADWSPIGTPGQINGLSGAPRALAGDGTNLYAGSTFFWAGQTNANQIARFDGTNWNPLGSGFPSGSGPLYSIAVSNNNVYVGGLFTAAGGVSAQNIAQWDGANWYALGAGPGGVVASVTVRSNGIYAAGAPYNGSVYGSPFFERWDGVSWQSGYNINTNDTFFALYFNDPLIGMDAVAFQDTNIYIGGHFSITWHDPTITITTNCMNIMRFDGTYARIMGTGLDSNVVAMAVVGTNLYVAGNFANAGGVPANRIAVWNGNNWAGVGGGVVGSGSVLSLAAIGNNLFAGGSFTNLGGTPFTHIARWDGTNWSALGSGTYYPGSTAGAVISLGAAGNNLYAGGTFRRAGDKNAFNIARWNGQINFNTPQLIHPAWLTNHQFQVRLVGMAGVTNLIQASTNLSTWTSVLTNSAGIYDFTDPNTAAYPYRFYRAAFGP